MGGPMGGMNMGMQMGMGMGMGFNGGQVNFKTVKCKFFDNGTVSFNTYNVCIGKTCPYGNKCTFAHGDEDLKAAILGAGP